MRAESKIFEGVYYVTSDNTPVNRIAIRPRINGKWITWATTGRDKNIEISDIFISPNPDESERIIPSIIEIRTAEGSRWRLEKITKEIFDKHIRDYVAGNPDFKDDQELQQYYLTTDFQEIDV